jgi:copper(I)-binding protein
MIRETANDVTAMYMTINNAGGADRLMSASTPISPIVQIHETVMADGAMKMEEVTGGIALAAGADTVFKPGGLHLMVMNLKAPLKAGETVRFELTFEKAGKMSLVVPVKTVGETAAVGGGGMAAATAMTGMSH